MKRTIITVFLIVTAFMSSSAYAEENTIAFDNSNVGICTLQGDELASISGHNVKLIFNQGTIEFGPEVSDYLIENSDGELNVGLHNLNTEPQFIHEDYITVSFLQFSRNDGRVIKIEDLPESIKVSMNLNYDVEDSKRLKYFWYYDLYGERQEAEAIYNEEQNTVQIDYAKHDGYMAVYYDLSEESNNGMIIIAAGAALFLIALAGSYYYLKKRK